LPGSKLSGSKRASRENESKLKLNAGDDEVLVLN